MGWAFEISLWAGLGLGLNGGRMSELGNKSDCFSLEQ